MNKFVKNPAIILIFIALLSFIIFFPSLNTFYTHDDFFLLRLSNAHSVGDFIGFFNLTKAPEGLGMYRPLAMQSFYLIARAFDLNPLSLHVVSFITFFGVICLVYKVTDKLTENKSISQLAAFFYAVSSSHFSHLYFLGVYQETAVTLFVLLSVLFFIKYLEGSIWDYVPSLVFFILAMLSKETALVTPVLFILVYFYQKMLGYKIDFKKFIKALLPIVILLAGYIYMRFNFFGFPEGDSYLIDVSPRIANTLFWYGLWAFNLPEMLVDFIGPGLRINLAPLLTWKVYILTSLISFAVILLSAGISKLMILNKDKRIVIHVLFGLLWFVITLAPVVIYPWHKFSYYLTLPLFGIAFALGYLCILSKSKLIIGLIVLFWMIGSVSNLILFQKTHWIIKGSQISENAYNYFRVINLSGKSIVFYDTLEDADSPWIPSQTLKNTLSDEDFFEVYFSEIKSVDYQVGEEKLENYDIKIRALDLVNI